ncbi:MAG: T9SS type A sorting domain-containing protein, partial [Bacteroidia bacterium]|nr:T9SS type A sorting domain-containing protein [Bacteroidia bacterium]
AGTLLNPWPKVAIDPIFNQAVFSWRNETVNGGACLFDAEFSTNKIDDVSNSDLTKLSLAPNPADREMTLNFTIEKSENILLQMRNVAGQEIVLNQNLQAIAGENSLQIDVSSFASGIYSLSIITSKGSFNQKIVLTH